MFDDYSENSSVSNFFFRLPSFFLAPIILSVPFIVVDFFNYYSAGTALAFSTPVLAILYAACGALAGKLAADREGSNPNFVVIGATAGIALWLASTVVNTIISLIVGAASLGTTLLLGIPYLCLCAPLQFIGGGLMGAFGGFIYSLFHKGSDVNLGGGDYYG